MIRRSGILLHPTSLPGACAQGNFGAEAHRFIEFLESAGQTIWQMLPLGPTHDNLSPYQCLSIHAGNPRLISFEWLIEQGWLEQGALTAPEPASPAQLYAADGVLARAWQGFQAYGDQGIQNEFQAFRDAASGWLDDYALFVVLREQQDHTGWTEWPPELRDRDARALTRARRKHRKMIELVQFEQFLFHHQWAMLKEHANRRGILLFGDMPIFVAHDSVDVWVNRHLFKLDDEGQPSVVAGVPPDYFSESGQRWGNPHYRWDAMAEDGYDWWIRRIEQQLTLFDLLRIDHFRGFEAYWEIPADDKDARNGYWVEGPREKLFDALLARLGELPLVAEDLGFITAEVHALREAYGFPGMSILQFAFDGSADNPYLPHNHGTETVVYTGTHDNDTTLGWYRQLDDGQRAFMHEYLGSPGEDMPWSLIRSALSSVAGMTVLPMQDVLALDGEHRMNTPGVPDGNWRWRFSWDQVPAGLAGRLRRMTEIYGRRD